MSQTYSVRINKKDLYKENYDKKEYKYKEGVNQVVINKSIVDVFIKMIKEYT